MLRLAILIALSCVTSALQMQRPPLLHARACLPGRARCGQHAMALDGFLLLSEAAVPTVAGAGGAPTANELVKIGASLAATSILATVLVGFIVSANYDNIEAAMYEEQDIARKNSIVEEDTSAARDFFGDVNVRPAAAAPPARPEEQSNPVE